MFVGKSSDLHNNDGLCCTTSVLLQLAATWQRRRFAYSCETVPDETAKPWHLVANTVDIIKTLAISMEVQIFLLSAKRVSHCSVSTKHKHFVNGKSWASWCFKDSWWWESHHITLSTPNCFNKVEFSPLSVFKTHPWNIDTEEKSQRSIQDLFQFPN